MAKQPLLSAWNATQPSVTTPQPNSSLSPAPFALSRGRSQSSSRTDATMFELPLSREHQPLITKTCSSHPLPSVGGSDFSNDDFEASGPSHSNWDYVQYYVPILRWLPAYKSANLHGDLAAGLSVACLSVPQSLSYARGLAGVSAEHGLFAASLPGFVYAILGTSRQLSLGPEAAGSLLIGQLISSQTAHLSQADRHVAAVAIATTTALQVGLITGALGLLRFGFLESLFPRPLIRGFLSAMGLVIFIEQLLPFLGLQEVVRGSGFHQSNAFTKATIVLEHLPQTHHLTLRLSLVSMALLLSARRLKRTLSAKRPCVQFIPEVLLLVLGSTLVAFLARWDLSGLAVLGRVTQGLAKIQNPLTNWNEYASNTLPTALVLVMVGNCESIVTAKQLASRFNYSVSANRELVAGGAANLFNSLVAGTLPAFGSLTRSRVNADAGAQSPVAALTTSSCILLSVFWLLPYLSFLPLAVMATVTLSVVFRILAELPHDLAFFFRMRAWADLGLMLIAFLLTLLWSVHAGILVGALVSLGRVVKLSSSMFTEALEPSSYKDTHLRTPDLNQDWKSPGNVVVAKFRDNLTFANGGAIKEQLRRLEQHGTVAVHPGSASTREPARSIILELSHVHRIDACAAQVLCETLVRLVNLFNPR